MPGRTKPAGEVESEHHEVIRYPMKWYNAGGTDAGVGEVNVRERDLSLGLLQRSGEEALYVTAC